MPPRGLYLTAVDFLGPAVGYATGFRRGSGATCAAAVFRTSDGGARWRLLPGSCRPYGLDAVEFLDAHTGFVGGGEPYYARDRPFQALLSTRDGGRSWRTVFRGRVAERANLPLNRLAFADPRHGLAVSAGCKTGQNGPCGGALLATLDGGRSWHATTVALPLAGS